MDYNPQVCLECVQNFGSDDGKKVWSEKTFEPYSRGSNETNANALVYYIITYGNTGCWVFKQGVHNWKDFCLKINIPKGNYWILRIGVMASFQILGIILVI